MRKIMTLISIAGFAVSAEVIMFFPFTTREHREMIVEIEQRRTSKDLIPEA